MNDLAEKVREASEHVVPEWSADHADRGLIGLKRKRRRRRARRAVAGVLSVATLVAIGWVGLRGLADPDRAAPQAIAKSPSGDAVFHLADGSVAETTGEGELAVDEDTPTRVAIRVRRGEGHFRVRHVDQPRTFQVEAAGVRVSVIGTRFTVTREPDRVGVSVRRGRVRVDWNGGVRELGAGERAWFPAADDARWTVEGSSNGAPPAIEPAPTDPPPAPRPAAGVGTRPSPANWQELADRGDFERAYDRLLRSRPPTGVAELLLAADVARMSGHAERAPNYLRPVLERNRSDPRAPLAAFTLGRVLLDALGRPRDAAEAFALARQLAPRGALAEDALARETEAWSRGGARTEARRAAETYLRSYPEGRRQQSVRRYGGVE